MNALEALIGLVVIGTVVVGLLDYLRTGGPLAHLGRDGALWFDHVDDHPIADRPAEDEVDPPINRRPLQGRFPL